MNLERLASATKLNDVANHPEVYPWVHGTNVGPLDLDPIVKDKRNVILWGEHGGAVFMHQQPAIYEIHVQVVPEGRGAWALEMVQSSLHWMFTRTDALEIVTRVPEGNKPALAMAKKVGFNHEFDRPEGWVFDHKPVPTSVHSLQIQGWMKSAPDLEERGEEFHRGLVAEYLKMGKVETPHPPDANHDRYVGAAVEMIRGGQPFKAVVFYNRWAALAGYQQISILKTEPVIIDIAESILMFKNDEIRVVACQ